MLNGIPTVCATTVSALTRNSPGNFSECSNGCTPRKSLKVPVRAWLWLNVSSKGTAAEFGPKPKKVKEQPSASPCHDSRIQTKQKADNLFFPVISETSLFATPTFRSSSGPSFAPSPLRISRTPCYPHGICPAYNSSFRISNPAPHHCKSASWSALAGTPYASDRPEV